MLISNSTARILVISQTADDRQKMMQLMARMPFNLTEGDFVVGKTVPTDDYHFAIFDAKSIPDFPTEKAYENLSEADKSHVKLLDRYLSETPIRYVIWFGERHFDLNRERCPSANSKFTLFARVRELIDFINHYKTE